MVRLASESLFYNLTLRIVRGWQDPILTRKREKERDGVEKTIT